MKYGIISDIHANYNAFNKVLERLDESGVERIINCGDIVGYGPEPQICCRKVMHSGNFLSVMGNHESALFPEDSGFRFNPAAGAAVRWTSGELSRESISFLRSLPYSGRESGFLFVHGTPSNPVTEYLFGPDQAAKAFRTIEEPLCFVGHTHVPACFKEKYGSVETLEMEPDRPIKLEPESRYIINPGSVGQPRDRDPRAAYCIYDEESREIIPGKVEYDIEDTRNKILDAGLPEFLAARLTDGI